MCLKLRNYKKFKFKRYLREAAMGRKADEHEVTF